MRAPELAEHLEREDGDLLAWLAAAPACGVEAEVRVAVAAARCGLEQEFRSGRRRPTESYVGEAVVRLVEAWLAAPSVERARAAVVEADRYHAGLAMAYDAMFALHEGTNPHFEPKDFADGTGYACYAAWTLERGREAMLDTVRCVLRLGRIDPAEVRAAIRAAVVPWARATPS